MLIVGTILATLRYDRGDQIDYDCRQEEIGPRQGC